jgi:hypothetical protein
MIPRKTNLCPLKVYQSLFDSVAPLTTLLWEMLGTRVARRFRDDAQRDALYSAIAEALSAAASCLLLIPEQDEHILQRFEAFTRREAVIEELSQLLDPRPDAKIDMVRLRAEFLAAKVVSGDGAAEVVDQVLHHLVAGFFSAAARQLPLQGVIEIGLLRQMVEGGRGCADRAGALAPAISAERYGNPRRSPGSSNRVLCMSLWHRRCER